MHRVDRTVGTLLTTQYILSVVMPWAVSTTTYSFLNSASNNLLYVFEIPELLQFEHGHAQIYSYDLWFNKSHVVTASSNSIIFSIEGSFWLSWWSYFINEPLDLVKHNSPVCSFCLSQAIATSRHTIKLAMISLVLWICLAAKRLLTSHVMSLAPSLPTHYNWFK